MSYQTLVDVETLAAHAAEPGWRIVDCRFDLGNPDAGRAAFDKAHIPGAVYAHLDHDLSGPRLPWSGRHPLPEPEVFAEFLGELGIGADTQVVAYDASGGIYAARLWWMLRWLGHRAVAVLDGGFGAWLAAGQPSTSATTQPATARFDGVADPDAQVSADEVERLLAQGLCVLVDARAPERFEGTLEPLDPRAGHVPGARNHHYQRNLGADGCFLAAGTLRKRLSPVLGSAPPSALVSMCGSGVTACHTLLALEVAGLEGARLYAGSWSEWCRDPSRAVATGPAPR